MHLQVLVEPAAREVMEVQEAVPAVEESDNHMVRPSVVQVVAVDRSAEMPVILEVLSPVSSLAVEHPVVAAVSVVL
jgi:hypothetical protein